MEEKLLGVERIGSAPRDVLVRSDDCQRCLEPASAVGARQLQDVRRNKDLLIRGSPEPCRSWFRPGMLDLDVDTVPALRATIRGCREPTFLPDVGHFVQEHGEAVAHAALRAFGDL